MRRVAIAGLALAIAALACVGWRWCGVETTVVLVRHADRAPGQKTDELAATGFARVMILPRELLGKSSIAYVKAEDLSKPKNQKYQVFVDTPIALP